MTTCRIGWPVIRPHGDQAAIPAAKFDIWESAQ